MTILWRMPDSWILLVSYIILPLTAHCLYMRYFALQLCFQLFGRYNNRLWHSLGGSLVNKAQKRVYKLLACLYYPIVLMVCDCCNYMLISGTNIGCAKIFILSFIPSYQHLSTEVLWEIRRNLTSLRLFQLF